MKFSEEIAQIMLNDPRYVGAIASKMIKVWRTRDTIPNQYFNPKYIELVKKGDEKANQVKDQYFNPKFILKMDLTEDEKALQERLKAVLSSKKINVAEMCRQSGLPTHAFNDFVREDGKSVDLRSEHLLALKKNLTDLKIKIKKVLEPLNLRSGLYSEHSIKQLDKLFEDERLFVLPLIGGNNLYRSRIHSRQSKKGTAYDREEIQHYINMLNIFLIESGI